MGEGRILHVGVANMHWFIGTPKNRSRSPLPPLPWLEILE
jgi:hypothetical protein